MKLEKKENLLSKNMVLVLLAVSLSVVSVFMNMFTSLRFQGVPGLTFGNVFFTWIPMLICDILIESYGKKKGIAIPAFIYLIQGIFFLLATTLVALHPDWLIWKTTAGGVEIFPVAFGDTFRIWAGSFVANYLGFFVNSFTMFLLKVYMPKSEKWYSLLFRAIMSSMLGQFVDNAIFMYFGLGMWDWMSLGIRQLVEVGMEVIFFPITYIVIKKINKLPDYEVKKNVEDNLLNPEQNVDKIEV